MTYICYDPSPMFRQMTFDEIISGEVIDKSDLIINDMTGSRTYCVIDVSDNKLWKLLWEARKRHNNVYDILRALIEFNGKYEELIRQAMTGDMSMHYDHWEIPKKSRKPRRNGQSYEEWHKENYRPIDAPKPELKKAQQELMELLDGMMLCNHHTAAHAYVKGRSTTTAVKRHQAWDSKWFVKFDFSKFFPSTTLDYTIKMLGQVFPFSNIIHGYGRWIGGQRRSGEEELRKALSICFLNGGLPQGTPISPWLTNVIMIPFDYKMEKAMRCFPIEINDEKRTERFVYTRYADDINVSCRVGFPFKKIEAYILTLVNEFEAPFTLNVKKTHYGSRNGNNYMLGVILNKDNNITPGHEHVKTLKAMMNNYIVDHKNGIVWPEEEIQKLFGLHSYYENIYKVNDKARNIENDTNYIAYIDGWYNRKYSVDVIKMMKDDLRAYAMPAGN